MFRNNIIRIFTLILVLMGACASPGDKSVKTGEPVDLEEIRNRGTLNAVTDFNSTNYFIYRGQPMGYQYELLQHLADHLTLGLNVVVDNNLDNNFNQLKNGAIDLIAVNLTITKERKEFLSFTEPHSQTRQVLVQRKPEGWRKMTARELESELIRNQLDLGGKTVYVQQASAYYERMKNLSDEIGDSITIVPVPEEAEQLITMVSEGEINYTVCDENVALVNQTYYPNIDIATPVSFPQNLAWAVRENAIQLKEAIDAWLRDFKKTTRYALIYNKYFRNQKSANMIASDYYTLSSGRISEYDESIRQYSGEIGWDWRLVASMIYQESRFNPRARSWAGAYGLMQLMPVTARRFGVSTGSSPAENIRAGIGFISWLNDRFKDEIPDEEERIKFILGSYNVGYGHVQDARKLARKYGSNPDIWDGHVAEFLLKKSDPEYYKDEVVKYGYCRGIETYNYVTEILERYEHYKNIIPHEEPLSASIVQ